MCTDEYMQIKICRGHGVASMRITWRILLDAKKGSEKFPGSVTSHSGVSINICHIEFKWVRFAISTFSSSSAMSVTNQWIALPAGITMDHLGSELSSIHSWLVWSTLCIVCAKEMFDYLKDLNLSLTSCVMLNKSLYPSELCFLFWK